MKLNNLKMIVCTDEEYGIGKDGSIPWTNRSEMDLFKRLTENHTVVMGRKTFESLPNGPLKNRTNIVVSKSSKESDGLDSTIWFKSREEVLEYAEVEADGDVWIIGGREIYLMFINDVDTVHLSVVDGFYECDTFLQELSRWMRIVDVGDTGWTRFQYRLGSGFIHYGFRKKLEPNPFHSNPSRPLIHRYLSAVAIAGDNLRGTPFIAAYLDGISSYVDYLPHQKMLLPRFYLSDMVRYGMSYDGDADVCEKVMTYFLALYSACALIERYNAIPNNADRRFECIDSDSLAREILEAHKDIEDLGLDTDYNFTELVYGCVPIDCCGKLINQ